EGGGGGAGGGREGGWGRRRGSRLARTCRQPKLEAARRDDGAAALPGRYLDRANAGGRQTPFRIEGTAGGRRRRNAHHARAVRHSAAMESHGAARRRGQRVGGRAAQ